LKRENQGTAALPKERETAMEFHRGRLVDHVHLRAADIDASKRFYGAVLRALGRELIEMAPGFLVADELCLTPSDGTRTHVHLAFQTTSREEVHRFYEAALLAGGRDNGKPGERHYHPGYYAAYVLDPDGNNIEAVHHGPAVRSAPSVIIRA
jgi:catechol 2,3-dioxygenase-like lactoylglutathione lyase family enzyme